jgi:hypothetical protein
MEVDVDIFAAIEVGQPVTRLHPRIPIRAELPHQVYQSCSLMYLVSERKPLNDMIIFMIFTVFESKVYNKQNYINYKTKNCH